MAHVFLSYSSKHRRLTERLRDYLKGKGLSVWFDQDALEARGPFDGQIRAGLQQAEVVVVIWTTDAIVSEWVKFEAGYAWRQRKLINVEPEGIDRSRIPQPFADHHRHVETRQRPIDMEKVFSEVVAIREGRPLPAEVPLRDHYERKYDELLLDTKRLPLPQGFAAAPSLLLQAKYALVGFSDLSDWRQRLVDWALTPRHGSAAGRLVHASGGSGKTRLMIEVAAALRERGWSAGFLNSSSDDPRWPDKPKLRAEALVQLLETGQDAGVALMIDYAEGRLDDVRLLAKQLAGFSRSRPERPLRLFLLTREIGEWWDALRRSDPSLTPLFTDEKGRRSEAAISLITTAAGRTQLLAAACQSFSRVFDVEPVVPPLALVTRIERDPLYARPLAILLEALLHVHGRSPMGGDVSIASLLDGTVDLERAHWRKVIPQLDGALERKLGRGASQVTLLQSSLDYAAAARLLQGDEWYVGERPSPASVMPIVTHLRSLFPSGATGVGPIEPDLLGERIILGELGLDVEPARALVRACLDNDSAGKRQWNRIITVLNRCSKDEHAEASTLADDLLEWMARAYADDLASTLIDVCLQEPQGALPRALMRAVRHYDLDRLELMAGNIPKQTLCLNDLAIEITALRIRIEPEPARRARLLSDQSTRLRAHGKTRQALQHALDACRIFDTLEAWRDPALARQASQALVSLSISHAMVGELREALETAERAVLFDRDIITRGVADHDALLASSLSNLANRQLRFGDFMPARISVDEAVSIRRRISTSNAIDIRPELARSLAVLSVCHVELGEVEQALRVTKECAGVYASLAKESPDAFELEYAGSLINLAKRLLEHGDPTVASRTIEQSLAVFRRIEHNHPGRIGLDLAKCLIEVCTIRRHVGELHESVAAGREATERAALHFESSPRAAAMELASATAALGQSLIEVGQPSQAASSAIETASRLLPWVSAAPRTFGPAVARLCGLHLAASAAADAEPEHPVMRRVERALEAAGIVVSPPEGQS